MLQQDLGNLNPALNLGPANPALQPKAGVSVPKPRSDIYTMMLFLSLLALGAAIALLCVEMSRFNWELKYNPGPPAAPAVSLLPAPYSSTLV